MRNKYTEDRIVSMICCSDYFDAPNVNELFTSSDFPRYAQHVEEIFANENVVNQCAAYSNNEYGVLCQGSHLVTNKEVIVSPLLSLFMVHLHGKLSLSCGYKYYYAEFTHPFSINISRKAAQTGGKILSDIDYSNYTFKDGTHIDYYFDKLRKNKRFPQKMITKLKERCKILVLVWDWNKDGEYPIGKFLVPFVQGTSSKL